MALKDYLSKENAWYLPKGSIRALLAGALTLSIVYLCIKTSNVEVLAGLAGAAIGYYFNKQGGD